MNSEDALVVFQRKQIRRTWHDNQWYFSVVDVSLRIGRPPDARTALGIVKDRASKQPELSPIWVQLKSQSPDGKYYRNRLSQTPKATSHGPEPQIPTHAPDRAQLRGGSPRRQQAGSAPPLARERESPPFSLRRSPRTT